MCGILGVVSYSPANQLLYDGLQVLQHRGQDAAGIATMDEDTIHLHKGNGLVRDVFRTRNMRALKGNTGIAHVRYPTAGSSMDHNEAQPFYVNSPFGIVLGHNGNLNNAQELKKELFEQDLRHINTNSDSEVLLNVLANELQSRSRTQRLEASIIFDAVSGVHQRCHGAYAVVAIIAGYGLLAFRDIYGIRPLVIGMNETDAGTEYLIASESVALDTLGFKFMRDIAPGEAAFIDFSGNLHTKQCSNRAQLTPCLFEYVYFSRPDSVLDGISVHEARLFMGEFLADKLAREWSDVKIDVVIPIPDSSRPSALQLASRLNILFREGFVKNRYIGRTFIMPGQAMRKKSVRQKLNAINLEFKGKNVLLVDDSIVRGTTSREIVQMARDAGALKVYFASAAPPVRFPNVYGIDMPSRAELIATGRTNSEICREIGADALIYQDLDDLKAAVRKSNPAIVDFEASCFNGVYITSDITPEYLDKIENARGSVKTVKVLDDDQMELELAMSACSM
jgi:amidophosphoribosyltransferase